MDNMTPHDTRQYLFDIAWQHMNAQGAPSRHDGVCRYRSPDGKSCAAAPFIISYSEELEGNPWDCVAHYWPERIDTAALQESYFVTELQDCHDNAVSFADPDGYMTRYRHFMRGLAAKYGLTIPTP